MHGPDELSVKLSVSGPGSNWRQSDCICLKALINALEGSADDISSAKYKNLILCMLHYKRSKSAVNLVTYEAPHAVDLHCLHRKGIQRPGIGGRLPTMGSTAWGNRTLYHGDRCLCSTQYAN